MTTETEKLTCCTKFSIHGHVNCHWPDGTTIAKTCLHDCNACKPMTVQMLINNLSYYLPSRTVCVKVANGNLVITLKQVV